jgi:hypothetical protein
MGKSTNILLRRDADLYRDEWDILFGRIASSKEAEVRSSRSATKKERLLSAEQTPLGITKTTTKLNTFDTKHSAISAARAEAGAMGLALRRPSIGLNA